LWAALGVKYQAGVDKVRSVVATWKATEPYVDSMRHNQGAMLLQIQLKEAIWWKDACMLYFQSISKLDFPPEMESPQHSLEHYKSLQFPYAPGIRPSWD